MRTLRIMILISMLICLIGCSKDQNDTVSDTLNGTLEILESDENVEEATKQDETNEALVEIDPFENVVVKTWGRNGSGCVSQYGTVHIQVSDSEIKTYRIKVDNSNNGNLKNGDVLRVELESTHMAPILERELGITLSHTETNILLDALPQAPANKDEVLNALDETSEQNLIKATEDYYKSLGMVVTAKVDDVYCDPTLRQDEFVFIMRVSNDEITKGWFTYMIPTNNILVKNKYGDNFEMEKVLVLNIEKPLSDNYFHYFRESIMQKQSTFEENQKLYLGHKTVEECINAYIQR